MKENCVATYSKSNNLQGLIAALLTPSRLERKSIDFFTLLKEKMDGSHQRHDDKAILPERSIQPDIKGSDGYLEVLMGSLMSKENPLDKVYLNYEDLPVLVNFLQRCGYSEERANQCIESMFKYQSNGAVKFSDFISQIRQQEFSDETYESPKESPDESSVVLESSTIPQIASVLMDLGLTLKETDQFINSARTMDGGLDLNRLIVQLRVIKESMDGKNRGMADYNNFIRVSQKLDKLGIQVPLKTVKDQSIMEGVLSGFVKLRDLKAGKEQVKKPESVVAQVDSQSRPTQMTASNQQSPSDVITTIERIISKALIHEEKTPTQFTKPILSKSLTDYSKAKTDGLASGTSSYRATLENGDTSYTDNEIRRGKEIREPEIQQRFNILSESTDYKKEGNHDIRVNSYPENPIENLPQGLASAQSEISPDLIQVHQPNRAFSQTTLFDQLSYQIYGAVNRGDGVIRLRLTPPELGTVKVLLDIKENNLRLGMVAENTVVRDILLANIHELKNSLSNQGIAIDGLDVQIGGDSGRSIMNSNENSWKEEGSQEESYKNVFSDNEDLEDSLPNPEGRAGNKYLLDFIA